MPNNAKAFITAVTGAGLGLALWSALNWQSAEPARFGLYLVLAALASSLKIPLPGLGATLSPGFVIVLVSAATSTWSETALIAPVAGLVQSLFASKRRPSAAQLLFNAGNLALASVLANLFSGYLAASAPNAGTLFARMCVALSVLYFLNSTAVSFVVCLIQGRPLATVWRLCNYYSIVGYFAGAVLAWMVLEANTLGWVATITVFTLVYPLYLFHKTWIDERGKLAV